MTFGVLCVSMCVCVSAAYHQLIMINNGRIRMDILVRHLFMLKNSVCASVYCILSYLISPQIPCAETE